MWLRSIGPNTFVLRFFLAGVVVADRVVFFSTQENRPAHIVTYLCTLSVEFLLENL